MIQYALYGLGALIVILGLLYMYAAYQVEKELNGDDSIDYTKDFRDP